MDGSTNPERLVVIGGGQAAAQLIEAARQEGFTGSIDLICDEAYAPYQRPPLSKQFLTGVYDLPWLQYRAEAFYTDNRVTLHLGRRAVAIDRGGQSVALDDGASLGYDRLALVMGARARRLAVSGSDLPNIFYVRTIADVVALQHRLPSSRRLVIVGGGFIGLETAAALVQRGYDITLLAQQERLIPRVVSAEISEYLAEIHRANGVHLHMRKEVAEFRAGSDGGIVVLCTDGSAYPADAVLAGVGALPNVELAQAAGLDCDNGIVVDEFARTSDPTIVAAGDCTNHPNPLLGRHLRLETVHNAVEQGRTAGATIAGKQLPYIQSPWVWSDQYKLRIQSVGLFDLYDHSVLRGDIASGKFSVFYFRGAQLLGVNTINQPQVFGAVRRILNAGVALTPQQAADTALDLATLPPRRAPLKFDIPWPIRRRGLSADAWGHA